MQDSWDAEKDEEHERCRTGGMQDRKTYRIGEMQFVLIVLSDSPGPDRADVLSHLKPGSIEEVFTQKTRQRLPLQNCLKVYIFETEEATIQCLDKKNCQNSFPSFI